MLINVQGTKLIFAIIALYTQLKIVSMKSRFTNAFLPNESNITMCHTIAKIIKPELNFGIGVSSAFQIRIM
jgi:hypothetical protein